MQIGNFIRVKPYGTYLGVHWENILHYRVEAVPNDPKNLNDLCTSVRTAYAFWAGFAHGQWVLDAVEAVNVNDTSEFGSNGQNATGGTSSDITEASPSAFAAYALYIRGSNSTRNGAKYLGGLPKSRIQGNSIVQVNDDVQNFFITLANTLSPANGGSFRPVICRYNRTPYQPIPVAYSTIRSVDFRGGTTLNRRKR
jgi:hypothetical protein